MNAIEVSGLRKTYGELQAVCGIDFAVPTGQVFAFLGPNGAGKTTTVEILEGYRNRSAGDVRVLGMDPEKGGRELRSRVGIVLQECGFPRAATVYELVALHASYYPKPRPADEVIALVGLEEKRNNVVKELSGGQQRRLDLALALVGNPDLIFLDEPTTGFDPSARREAWEVVRNLRNLGKTIFLTTHYMEEAQYLADRVAVISDGRIIADAPPSELGGPDSAYTEIHFALASGSSAGGSEVELPDLGQVLVERRGNTVIIRADDPTPLLHRLTGWALEQGISLTGLTVSRPSLEDIYLKLTASGKDNHPS